MRQSRVIIKMGLLLLLFCFAFCARKEEGQSIHIGLNSKPLSLDPHFTNESVSYIVNSNIYDTLVRTDPDLQLIPSIATKWTNPDDLTWVLDLRSDVLFHNGKPLTSEDVVYSLHRVIEHPRSGYKGVGVAIQQIEASSPYQVMIRTKRPYPVLLKTLTDVAIVPKEYVESQADSPLERHPVGSGPYEFVSYSIESGIVQLRRWKDYYGTKPEIGTVVFDPIVDNRTRCRSLLAGKTDMITDVPVDGVVDMQQDPEIQLLQVPGLRELYLSFDIHRTKTPYVNTEENPFLDKRVRKAFLHAIDRERIIREILKGYGEKATQFTSKSVFGFNSDLEDPEYNVESARQLLADAGYPDGFSVTLDSPQNVYQSDSSIADFVATSLRDLQVDVRLNKLNKSELFDKLKERDTSFYMISWSCLSADAQEIFLYLLHTPDPERGYGSENWGAYSNVEFDRLAEKAEQIMNPANRLLVLQQAVAAAYNDFPWVPLYVQTHIYGLRKPFHWIPRKDKLIQVSEITLD